MENYANDRKGYEEFQKHAAIGAARNMGRVNRLYLLKNYSGDSDKVDFYLNRMTEEGKLSDWGDGLYQMPLFLVSDSELLVKDDLPSLGDNSRN